MFFLVIIVVRLLHPLNILVPSNTLKSIPRTSISILFMPSNISVTSVPALTLKLVKSSV